MLKDLEMKKIIKESYLLDIENIAVVLWLD